jgi:hypothetical protein
MIVRPARLAQTIAMNTTSPRVPAATRLTLLLAGMPLLLIGLAILIDPPGFQASAGITVGTDPSDIGAAVHLGYGSARLLSLVLDGAPNAILILAVSAELPLGAACVLAAYRLTRSRARNNGPALQPLR